LKASAAAPGCAEVASSECSKDQPSVVFEDQLASEQECVNFCKTFAASALGCSFAAWTKGALGGKCVLYNEDFAEYIGHCELLSGPPDVSGCPVDDPSEGSCDGIREGECVQQGQVLESTSSVSRWEDCANFCQFSDSCQAWTYRHESRRCKTYDSLERVCATSYTPSGVDTVECGAEDTSRGLIISGGDRYNIPDIKRSVEVFSPNEVPDCSIPELDHGRVQHTMSLLDESTLVVCGGCRSTGGPWGNCGGGQDNCISWSKSDSNTTWQHFADLSPIRGGHVAYSNTKEKKILLMGGEYEGSNQTGVELPGGRTFELHHEAISSCLIPLDQHFVIVGKTVDRYTSTGEFVEEMPELNIPRRDAACSSFADHNGDIVLVVVGGYEIGSPEVFSSTEFLLPGAAFWTYGPDLYSPAALGRAANINGEVFLIGGYTKIENFATDEIWKLNLENQRWDLVHHMSEVRSRQAVAAVNLKNFCD